MWLLYIIREGREREGKRGYIDNKGGGIKDGLRSCLDAQARENVCGSYMWLSVVSNTK
jgi:hypothetical protein